MRPEKVIDAKDAKATVDLLASLHHGILAMSPDVPELVQNSTNLATVAIKGDVIEIVTSQRSAIAASKDAAARMVATACRLAGFETEYTGSYPGWKPEPTSDIVRKLQSVHEKVFGHPAKLIAMHAGLECGVIGEKYPGMQMVSFGPTIVGPHSPDERVEISSVDGFLEISEGGAGSASEGGLCRVEYYICIYICVAACYDNFARCRDLTGTMASARSAKSTA